MEPSSDVSTESIDASVQKSTNRVRKRKKQLYADLRKQMEFYLSDANLRKDRFFGHLMQTNQCINVETFLNCNKIKSLTTNPEVIVKAIKGSNVLTVSDCKTKIHRIKPVEDKTPEDIERCTVYVEQLPPKADHDWVKSTFEKYGSVAYISLPKFKSGSIKRFAFVEFDNEESANKVLEEYRKLNVESKILPEELQSIITFKEDEKNKDEGLIVNENIEVFKSEKKRKLSSSTDCVKEKKRKREIEKITPIVKNEKKTRKKDKYKKNGTNSDHKNSSYEKSDNENNQNILASDHFDLSIVKSKTTVSSIEKVEPNNYVINSEHANTSNDSSITENNQNTFSNKKSNLSTNKSEITVSNEIIQKESNMDYNNDSAIKKKRKRNKGKKIKSDTITTPELRIMSKTEWRKLRNQFLNMQRQKMSLLKVQLRHPKYTTSYLYANKYTNPIKVDPSANEENVELKRPKTEDLRVKYEPGVILKVSFTNPIESEKLFKTEAKTDSNVKYVDVLSNFEAYIRCSCSESAKKIAEEDRWPQTRQLEGEEEKLYWEKILRDREIKCSKQKETKKPRGRNKLINRAEKTLAQHIKFVQEDK